MSINIAELEKSIAEYSTQWIKFKEDSQAEFKFVKPGSRDITSKFLISNKNGISTEQIEIDVMFDSFVDWRNVNLKDVLEQDLIDSLIEDKKITKEELELPVPFSKKLFDNYLTINGLSGDMFVAIGNLNTKKNKSKTKKLKTSTNS